MTSNTTQQLIDNISLLKIAYQKVLQKDLTQSLQRRNSTHYTYTSNALEWNTLTEIETSLIINEGISVGWKKVVEIQEALNHAKAVSYIIWVDKDDSFSPCSEVLHIHSLILDSINDSYAWVYRDVPVRIQWSRTILPNYAKVPDLMQSWEDRLLLDTRDTVLVAIQAHYDLVTIHPFIDGNGRTARLFMNLLLCTDWHPLISIEIEDRQKYIETLEATQLGWAYTIYENMILGFIVWSYERILES
jgi:Fic family protein